MENILKPTLKLCLKIYFFFLWLWLIRTSDGVLYGEGAISILKNIPQTSKSKSWKTKKQKRKDKGI